MASTAVLTPEEREAAGKAARRRVRRSDQAAWEPPAGRPDPVDTLTSQDRTRLPDLVPIRHGRMLASAFSFYRGAAAIMAADLASVPSTELTVQLCGDAHLSNFGVFLAPDRRLIFDINDFDETLPGPFEWDVKRLAASFAVAARELGFKRREGQEAVKSAVSRYREVMRQLAGEGSIEVWYERVDVDTIEQYRSMVGAKEQRTFDKNRAKAERKNSMRAFAKLARRDGDGLRIVSDPPLVVPIDEVVQGDELAEAMERMHGFVDDYRGTLQPHIRQLADRYRYEDAAHKVVGVGSVGTRCWIVLLVGRDLEDPLFLQAKEAGPSALAPYLGGGRYKHQGRRVVEGQRLMQAASDIMLGWLTGEGLDGTRRDFYVRQLWDGKGSAEIGQMTPLTMSLYAHLCGGTLARAHARSGDRIAIASYLGGGEGFDRAVTEFADAYADQNERDYAAFSDAVESGRLAAERDI